MIDTCPVADMNIKMVGSSQDELQLVYSWICALLCVKLRRSQVDFSRISKFNMHPIMSLNIKRDAIQLMKPGFFFSPPFHFRCSLLCTSASVNPCAVHTRGSRGRQSAVFTHACACARARPTRHAQTFPVRVPSGCAAQRRGRR